jgi:hypothetical protein
MTLCAEDSISALESKGPCPERANSAEKLRVNSRSNVSDARTNREKQELWKCEYDNSIK